MEELSKKCGEILEKIRQNKPLIHNITNFVVMNYTANALLSLGASPVMAHAPEEVEEMASISSALVLNIGTLTLAWIESMIKAGKKANGKGIPVILDPVGSGATKLRTDSSLRILDNVKITTIRGNASEIMSLISSTAKTKGVDSLHKSDETIDISKELAKKYNCIVASTGVIDIITDGKELYKVHNGHSLMGKVTGTGCTASVIVASFNSVEKNYLESTTCALSFFGLAGEIASKKTETPGSYSIALLDSLYTITSSDLQKGCKIEKG